MAKKSKNTDAKTARTAAAKTTPKVPGSGGFTLCKITSGPDAGKVKVQGIFGKAILLEGHNSSIRLAVYKNPVPANVGPGPYSAPIDETALTFNYDDKSVPIIINNPCTGTTAVKLSLVVHHIFEPQAGGIVQQLCEVIEKKFTCPIKTNCP